MYDRKTLRPYWIRGFAVYVEEDPVGFCFVGFCTVLLLCMMISAGARDSSALRNARSSLLIHRKMYAEHEKLLEANRDALGRTVNALQELKKHLGK
jgi:hypothetical protein